jgi:predicted Ser/Thr protein kinase
MRYILDIKECKLLGKGDEGSVYLTPEGFALKIFSKEKNAKAEAEILEKAKDSRFFPNVIFLADNMMLREYVAGENLHEFINNNGLSYNLSMELIELIEDFKRLQFTRINIRNAHIFVNENEEIQIIDPRKTYSKNTPYPRDIISILVKLNLFDDFLKNLIDYKPELLQYWIDGYEYFEKMSKKTIRINMYAC